jgi:3-dehydroquinate synthase
LPRLLKSEDPTPTLPLQGKGDFDLSKAGGVNKIINNGLKLLKTIKVNLKNNPYNIYIGQNSINDLNALIDSIKDVSKIAIITNNIVAELYLNNLKSTISDARKIETFVVSDGEINKSLKQTEEIYSWMIEKKFDRNSLIIAFGGGVIGDLAGFVAATYLRSVRFVQIPTTLLAQVDSSIGGKVGVNHVLGKNLIGAFYQPQFVLSDMNYLKTLNSDEYISGMGEVVKYGLIGDKALFEFIKKDFADIASGNFEINEKLVSISAQQKANVVEQDEREMGIRAFLNFGHTFGHALEKYYNYKKLKHGQAVLLGMKCAVIASQQLNNINEKSSNTIIELINRFNVKLPQKLTESNISDLLNYMQHDKKIKNDKINFILIKDIGHVFKSEITDDKIIREAFESLN